MPGVRFRLLPRGLAGWSLLILINVLLLMAFGQLVVLKLISQQVSSYIERDTIADRVFVLDKVFRATPVGQWPELVATLDQPNFRVRLGAVDPNLLAEREREKPLLRAADIAGQAWSILRQAEQAWNRGDNDRAHDLVEQGRGVVAPAMATLKELSEGSDPVIARVSADILSELTDSYRQASSPYLVYLARKGLSWLEYQFQLSAPNTASFVPARTDEMPAAIFAAMEMHAQRLNQSSRVNSGHSLSAVTILAQRVSPFVRAWYGPRFDERPYLLRTPENPSTLRVVLPASPVLWVVFDAGTAESVVADFTPYLIGFTAAGLLISVLTTTAIMRLTAPISRFAEATERLGRDINARPLAPSGPAEVRKAILAFNEMQGRIQAYVRDRTTMLAAISHDLRTPLTRLRLRGEFMADEQQEKYHRDLDEMEAMIAAAMDFARGDAKSEDAADMDAASLIKALSVDMTEAGKPVTCLYNGPPIVVSVRPMAFKRAITNLLENAIAYGTTARISIAEVTGGVEITIDDDGPGIPNDQMEQVFAPFYRLETSRNRKTGGVGLGLATVRSVVRSHGGDVFLSNRPSTGSHPSGLRVRVFLPR